MRGEADFSTYRRSDVFFHLGIAEASGRRGWWRR